MSINTETMMRSDVDLVSLILCLCLAGVRLSGDADRVS